MTNRRSDDQAKETTLSCLFCRIAAGEIPANKVLETDMVLAFHDLNPQAPVHVLVIPKAHLDSLGAADDSHAETLSAVMLACRQVAKSTGVAEGGYRVVLNTGANGGQTVGHLHAHVLGGRSLGWPPG
jgi:histidine triad (HIT) family protein